MEIYCEASGIRKGVKDGFEVDNDGKVSFTEDESVIHILQDGARKFGDRGETETHPAKLPG
jgi:hypothetical protein